MKRMAICAIIRNAEDELLIVEPTYRNDWLLPEYVNIDFAFFEIS
jgi:hypothetical protein